MISLQKRRSVHRGKVIMTWMITYACLFLVMLCLWFAVVSISQNILNKQTYRINRNTINILASSIDENFSTIEKLMAQLGINKQIMRKSYHQFTIDGYDAYTSKEILDTLGACKVGHAYIEDIFLYLPQAKNVISISTASSSRIYFESYFSGTDLAMEDWEALMSQKHILSYQSVKKGDKYDGVLLLQTIPSAAVLKSSKSAYSTLAIKVDMTAIKRMADEFANANSVEINIYDADKNLLVHSGALNNREISRSIVITSENNQWTYEMNIPSKVYFGEAYYLIGFMTAALLISFIVFCTLSVYFTRKNYSPLKELLESVKGYRSSDAYDGSEYMFLHESFKQIVAQQKHDKEMLAEQMEKIRTTYICRLLTGGMRRADVDSRVFENLQMEWLLEPCLILIIKPLAEWESAGTPLEIAASLGIGQKESCRLQGYPVMLNKMLVVIIRDGQERQQLEHLKKYAESINGSIEGYVMAVSSFDRAKSISDAYDEAVYAMQYAEYLSQDRIVVYDSIDEERYPRRYAYVDEWKLADAIKNQDEQEVLRLMSETWKINTQNAHLRMSDIRFLLALQLSSYFKTVCMLYPEFYQNGFPVDLRKISEMNGTEEMCRILEQVVETSFEKMKKFSAENKEERLKLEVLQYIEENFRDPDLTVEKLCRAFGKSVPYFSRLFKGISGEGLLYYINSRRIQEAKYLMKNDKGSINVGEVCEKVGFTNVNSFIRIFKKYEGITPGKYKEMVQQMERNR